MHPDLHPTHRPEPAPYDGRWALLPMALVLLATSTVFVAAPRDGIADGLRDARVTPNLAALPPHA